jgi:polyisoprenyl-teichoic acid--peptidoglycan teichoic acid transferase
MRYRRSFPWILLALACVGALGLAAAAGAVWIFAPEWWAVPSAVSEMTGQRVPELALPLASESAQPRPADNNHALLPVPSSSNTPGARPVAAPTPSGPLLPQRRFTVLLLGSDNDLKFAPDAVLTQAMILVSVDPNTRQVAMVSIPRDFWVPIPGHGTAKIDVAYEIGGLALARSTVERLFGVGIDYYAWVGLDGLVNIVDALGGVDVTVLHPVLDEVYPDDLNTSDPYAYFRLYIPAGPQHLDGRTALEYVRSRHGDLQSDFGRSARQQQLLTALKSAAEDPSVVVRVPQLVAALKDAVRTDLSFTAITQLALLSRGIPADHIQREILSAPRFARLGSSPDGLQQVVLPEWTSIRPAVARLLDLHDPLISDTLAQNVWQENATVLVLNGSAEPGLAARLSAYLAWQGFNVLGPANADRADYPSSIVIGHTAAASATSQALANLLHTQAPAKVDSGSGPAITVVVGRDHPSFPDVNNT